MRVVHLEYPDGSVYCGSDWKSQQEKIRSAQNWKSLQPGERKCLRCLRKLHRIPINEKVPRILLD